MYAILVCVLGVLPQADRQALVLQRAQIQQESRLRANHPAYFAARGYQGPQTEVNVYAPTYVLLSYGYTMPYNYYGYGWGRPAWPPQW